MEYYAGLDVSLEETSVCLVDGDGAVVHAAKVVTEVEAIAESIIEHGQQLPIQVRPDKGRYVLVNGLHRFEALKALGEETIQALIIRAGHV